MGAVVDFPKERIVRDLSYRSAASLAFLPLSGAPLSSRCSGMPLAQRTALTRSVQNNVDEYDFTLDAMMTRWIIDHLGCNATSAYVTISRGCTHTQRATLWSTTAVEKRTGMDGLAADEAVRALLQSGVISKDKLGRRPAYRLLALGGESDLRIYSHDYSPSGGAFVEAIESARKAGDLLHMNRVVEEHGRIVQYRQRG